MSDIKKIKNFRQLRQKKVIETLEQKQKRHDDFLNRLDEIADKVLSKRLSGEPATVPTETELAEMRRDKPEIFDVCESLFTVADKMNKL